jgi:hypothetical protein
MSRNFKMRARERNLWQASDRMADQQAYRGEFDETPSYLAMALEEFTG